MAAASLACNSSGNAPSTPAPPDSVAGGAGASDDPGGADAGATGEPLGGASGQVGLGEGGALSMPGTGGAPTEPGSWNESFWDQAVWQ